MRFRETSHFAHRFKEANAAGKMRQRQPRRRIRSRLPTADLVPTPPMVRGKTFTCCVCVRQFVTREECVKHIQVVHIPREPLMIAAPLEELIDRP